MKIWIDGDACPKKIKEILFKAAIRTKTELILVANHFAAIPASSFIKRQHVGQGFDVADQYISQNIQTNDLVITADIPLAHEVVKKGATALNPRGNKYTLDNINQILAMRNLNESLRETGMIRGGGLAISPTDIRIFSNNLDKILAQMKCK